MRKNIIPAFTLFEIVTYVTVLAIIAGAISSLVFLVYRHKTWVEDRVTVNEDMRVVVKAIRDDMYLGAAVEQINASSFVITRPGISAITYNLIGSRITRQENGNTPVGITSQLTDVRTFNVTDISTPDTAGTVRINFVLANFPSGTLKPETVQSLETTFSLKFR